MTKARYVIMFMVAPLLKNWDALKIVLQSHRDFLEMPNIGTHANNNFCSDSASLTNTESMRPWGAWSGNGKPPGESIPNERKKK